MSRSQPSRSGVKEPSGRQTACKPVPERTLHSGRLRSQFSVTGAQGQIAWDAAAADRGAQGRLPLMCSGEPGKGFILLLLNFITNISIVLKVEKQSEPPYTIYPDSTLINIC